MLVLTFRTNSVPLFAARRIHPMERVLEYMKLREIRPVEMFRDFDKSVTFDMSKETFMQRMKNTLGVRYFTVRLVQMSKEDIQLIVCWQPYHLHYESLFVQW